MPCTARTSYNDVYNIFLIFSGLAAAFTVSTVRSGGPFPGAAAGSFGPPPARRIDRTPRPSRRPVRRRRRRRHRSVPRAQKPRTLATRSRRPRRTARALSVDGSPQNAIRLVTDDDDDDISLRRSDAYACTALRWRKKITSVNNL